jgi:hypothetical protein
MLSRFENKGASILAGLSTPHPMYKSNPVEEYVKIYGVEPDMAFMCFRYTGREKLTLYGMNITFVILGLTVNAAITLNACRDGTALVAIDTRDRTPTPTIRKMMEDAITREFIRDSTTRIQRMYVHIESQYGAPVLLRDVEDMKYKSPESYDYACAKMARSIDVGMRGIQSIEFI